MADKPQSLDEQIQITVNKCPQDYVDEAVKPLKQTIAALESELAEAKGLLERAARNLIIRDSSESMVMIGCAIDTFLARKTKS
jgi:hypothetical protein